jgi:hypothetical protein
MTASYVNIRSYRSTGCGISLISLTSLLLYRYPTQHMPGSISPIQGVISTLGSLGRSATDSTARSGRVAIRNTDGFENASRSISNSGTYRGFW